MKFNYKYKSPNFNNRKKGSRIENIIIHYTAMSSDIEALQYLCNKKNIILNDVFFVNRFLVFNKNFSEFCGFYI